MIKKYLSSLTIKGLIGAGTLGIVAPYVASFFFSSVRAEIQYTCFRSSDADIELCEHRLGRLDRTEGFVNSVLAALGLGGVVAGVEGRRRAKGPLKDKTI